MPRTCKRKVPVTYPNTNHGPSSSSRQSSRTVIRRFHVLIKRQKQLRDQNHLGGETSDELTRIEDEINELGGLECYQRMSTIGQDKNRGGGSEKVLIKWMRDFGLHKKNLDTGKIKLLEVGALKPDNYRSCSTWLQVTPIDLHSRHPQIKEQDFLLMDKSENLQRWDVISLSLVLNFVPEPNDRGKMLCLAKHMLVSSGYLFLALPLPCVTNSRYLTFSHLENLMKTLGFSQLNVKWREGGKMAYWLYQKQDLSVMDTCGFEKKSILLKGPRNNFSIVIPPPNIVRDFLQTT